MKVTDEALMLFHDGELDAEQARAVRVGRLHHAHVTARLETLTTLGDAVRRWAADTGVDAAAERRTAERRQGRRRLLGVGATVLVAALGLPFALLSHGRAGAGSAPRDLATSTREGPLAASGPVAVETVDFGVRPGAVFLVEGEAQSETTVIWLSDASAGPKTL